MREDQEGALVAVRRFVADEILPFGEIGRSRTACRQLGEVEVHAVAQLVINGEFGHLKPATSAPHCGD